MISYERTKELFDYLSDGELVWKVNVCNVKSGSLVGSSRKDGYKMTSVDCKKYLVHRLIFLWHKGYMPEYIDHIDGDTRNNKIENLRECTLSQNQQNRRLGRDNKTGVKGVSWHKKNQKWRASIRLNKEQIHLGLFEDFDQAVRVIEQARMSMHREFSKL